LVRVDNIATLESARGRGYGLALTAAAAAVDPSKPATLIASDLGRPVYDRLGFVAVMRFTYWLGLRS
jgi:GNAT superfamily N-acetyltransferase